jgi:subtilisin family serine protease
MRAAAQACILTLAILGAGTGSGIAAPPEVDPTWTDAQHPRIVVTFANEPRQSPGPAGTTGRRYTGDGYLIAQSAYGQAKRVAATYSLREVANWPIRALAVHCVVYEIPDGRPVASVLAALSKDARVGLAQPLQEFHTLSESGQAGTPYNDPLYDLQTNLGTLGIPSAHARSQGAGVRIALIDTGVDARHPDLHGRITRTQSFLASQAPSPRSYRHGTAMAGLIAAVANNHVGIVGIAPLAHVEVFEACWQLKPDTDEAVCNTFTLAEALSAALDAHIPLVNLSIAGPADPLLSALVEAGLKRGVTFVGAAAEPPDAFPTAIAGVIAVEGNEHALKSATLAAPAAHVLTLRPESQYDFESGTSVAAAEVTGVVALLMSAANGHLTTDTVVSLLKETSATTTSAASPSVNVDAALAKLDVDQHRGRVATRAPH